MGDGREDMAPDGLEAETASAAMGKTGSLLGITEVVTVEVEETGTAEADAEGAGPGKLDRATLGPDVVGGTEVREMA